MAQLPEIDKTDLDIKKLKVRLPYQLRSHQDFGNAKIRVDEDQIHFSVTGKEGLPELWIFDATRKSWYNVEFLDSIHSQA